MYRDEKPYIMAFSHMTGVGPLAFNTLISRLGDSYEAYRAPQHTLEKLIGAAKAHQVIEFRKKHDPHNVYNSIVKRKIHIVTREEASFPPLLRHIYDVPICLYVRGDLKRIDYSSDFMFAVVGTRDASPYGTDMTNRIVADLARAGMVIVSGMAQGIDTAAHTTCLSEGGRTVVVLGSGIDIIYPRRNNDLYHRVIETGGIVISEFPPGMTVQKGLFVSRNRIISGMSRGVLVVEGTEKSGSLISARLALQQGRDVFAVPGLVTSDLSRAPHMLIREGAQFVTCADHILEEYRIGKVSRASMNVMPDLPQEERDIYRSLLRQPLPVDDIVADTGIPVQRVLQIVSLLELKGLVRSNAAMYVALSPA